MRVHLQMYGGGDYICRMHNKSHRLKKNLKQEQKSKARGNADKKVVEREKAIKISKQTNSENNNSFR